MSPEMIDMNHITPYTLGARIVISCHIKHGTQLLGAGGTSVHTRNCYVRVLTIGCLIASEIFLLYDKHIRPPNTHMSSLHLTRLSEPFGCDLRLIRDSGG